MSRHCFRHRTLAPPPTRLAMLRDYREEAGQQPKWEGNFSAHFGTEKSDATPAPVLGVWYRSLDRLIVGQSKAVAFKKMLLDQFALAPCFLACFFIVTGFLGGHSREEIQLKIQKDYKKTLISNYFIQPDLLSVSSVFCFCFIWLPFIQLKSAKFQFDILWFILFIFNMNFIR
uniref:mitochondrial inner membrane protein Mpv17 isoform X3 n=1 Tax=Pristiophorus japonicus TaxID=55135 RepID=UPI00398EC134